MSKASNTLDSISTIPSKAEQEHHLTFESLKQEESEFWSARKLAKALEYSEYRNFLAVIEKAKEACKNSSHSAVDHFVDITEMIELGKGGKPKIAQSTKDRFSEMTGKEDSS